MAKRDPSPWSHLWKFLLLKGSFLLTGVSSDSSESAVSLPSGLSSLREKWVLWKRRCVVVGVEAMRGVLRVALAEPRALERSCDDIYKGWGVMECKKMEVPNGVNVSGICPSRGTRIENKRQGTVTGHVVCGWCIMSIS